VSDLLLWLTAVTGHWQHWLGGSLLGAGVALTAGFTYRTLRRRVPWGWCAALFVFTLLLDASYLAWRDEYHQHSPGGSAPMPSLQPLKSDIVVSRIQALELSSQMMQLFVSRGLMEPKPPKPESERVAWQQETLSQFKSRFDASLMNLLADLNAEGVVTGEIEAILRGVNSPEGFRDIAARLNLLGQPDSQPANPTAPARLAPNQTPAPTSQPR
jgi:hypothetical protein